MAATKRELRHGERVLGLITGQELPRQTGRGRPMIYINADARKLHARLREVENYIEKLAVEVTFTEEAEKQMRSRLGQIANRLNLNRPQWKLDREQASAEARRERRRKKNPTDRRAIHVAVTPMGPNGEMMPLCNIDPHAVYQMTPSGLVWCCSIMVTEWGDMATCEECVGIYEDTKARAKR
jgi:hypothetical protein